MAELAIVTFAREKGKLVERFNALQVGKQYMLIPKNLCPKMKFGIFKIIRKGVTRLKSFQLEGEENARLFTNYYFLEVVQS